MTYGSMIDCTNAAFAGLVTNLKTYPDVLAGYVTGTSDIDWSSADWAEAAAKCGTFRYDQSVSLASFAAGKADGADIENGAGTAANAINAAKERQGKGWDSWFYISASGVYKLTADIRAAGLTKVQLIVANWNLSLAEASGQLGALTSGIQWASPMSNPNTICPGTSRTLSELNVDLTVTQPGFFAKVKPKPPAAILRGIVVDQNLITHPVTSNPNGWALSLERLLPNRDLAPARPDCLPGRAGLY